MMMMVMMVLPSTVRLWKGVGPIESIDSPVLRKEFFTSWVRVSQYTSVERMARLPLVSLPATTTEDNDEDNEDTEGTSGHTNDDGQLLGIRNMNARSSEGQSDILLCHSPVVDGYTGVLTQVIAGHRSYCQTKVSFDTAYC